MMGRTLYLEGTFGISGAMAVAALLDLGAEEETLRAALSDLPLDGYRIEITRVKRAGTDACAFRVILDAKSDNESCDTENAGYRQDDWTLADVERMINSGKLNKRVREKALLAFRILAEAEEEIHFRKADVVELIVDIVAAAVCMDNLDITEVIVPSLSEGSGSIRCRCGIVPVPLPTVVNIAKRYGIALKLTKEERQMITPEGAALVAAFRTGETLPKQLVIQAVGIGADEGKENASGMLRAMLIEEKKEPGNDVIYKLETNIDDCTGENLGYVMERLLEAGAKDAHYLPVYMKKNRPAYQLDVICDKGDIHKLEEIIFANTTTIGIRRVEMERTILPRRQRIVNTSYGPVEVKCCMLYGEERSYPEYESVAEICRKKGLPYAQVYAEIVAECNNS